MFLAIMSGVFTMYLCQVLIHLRQQLCELYPIMIIILQIGTRGTKRVSNSFKVRWIINVELEFKPADGLLSLHS